MAGDSKFQPSSKWTNEHWHRVEELLQHSLELEPDQRNAFLAEACAEDEILRREVESLLQAHDSDGSFLELPVEVLTEVLALERQKSLLGRRVGPFQIESLVGSGGMGEVYRATDTRLGRTVAIKVLPVRFSRNPELSQRLEREARAISRLNHPNICTLYDIGRHEDLGYLVMEYLEGETLESLLTKGAKPLIPLKHGWTKTSDLLDLAIQISMGLDAAHQQGIVHRDIKPANILLTSGGQAKILDFGLAKLAPDIASAPAASASELPAVNIDTDLTQPGAIVGTVAYMSPEQARGEELDARSDLFSLGSVLYVMATGQLAFGGATAAVIFDAILNRTPIAPSRLNPELPPKLDEIMSKLLDKDRNLRYQHAADLEADLRRLKRESDAHPTDFPARPTDATLPKDRSRPKLLLLASIALAAVAVVALFRTSRTSVLTERDVILLADFVNTTGDPQFDGGALKQGLASYLEQSPHLNIFPEDRVREALRYMARSPDESVTDAVAREICQREDIKAVLGGSIAALGAHYLITLDAVNCTSGESLVPREQREANSKEQVVEQLGKAASSLRANLGESLASLQRFDTPLERATTTSLEGLRSFTEGRRLNSAGAFRQAIPFLQKSVDLDPDFALGQYLLGTAYGNQNQWDRANPQTQLGLDKLTTAFNLRHRATELEKQSIAVYYQMRVLGDLNGARETSEFLKQIYQRDYPTRHLLGNIYAGMGRFEEALAEHEEAVRLRPNSALSRASVALDYAALHQLGHASEILNKAMQEKVEFPFMHGIRYEIAFMQGDANVMRQETEWAKGNPDGASQVLNAQARGALFSGRLGEVRKVFRDNRRWPHLNPFEPALLGFSLSQSALHGQTDDLATLAILGEPSRVLALIEELRKAAPQDTVLNFIDIPVAKAYLEIRAGNGTKAVDLLNTATPYERGYLRVTYTRGQAYLQAGLFNEAAAEFKKLIGHRGVEPLSVLYPLSHLGLGRAYAGAKDMARARKSYSDFLKIWSGADPDIPILIQAKQEYGRLISN